MHRSVRGFFSFYDHKFDIDIFILNDLPCRYSYERVHAILEHVSDEGIRSCHEQDVTLLSDQLGVFQPSLKARASD